MKEVTDVKATAPNVYEATVAGDFTLHGVTKRITVPVTATLLAGKAKERSSAAIFLSLAQLAIWPGWQSRAWPGPTTIEVLRDPDSRRHHC